MKRISKIVLIVAVLVLGLSLLTLGAPQPAPKKVVNIEILGMSKGASGYALTFGLSELINEKSTWLRTTCVESTGSVENARSIMEVPGKKYNTFGFGNLTTLFQVATGAEPFKAAHQLKLIAINMETTQMIATLDPKLKTPQDFIGKTACFLPWGNGTEVVYRAMFDNWGIRDKVKYTHGSYERISAALRDRTIDAGDQPCVGTMVTRVPVPALEELLVSKHVYFFPIKPEDVAAAAKRLGWTLTHVTHPPKYFSDKQVEEATGYLTLNGWWCDPELGEDIVYEVCRIIHENYDKFKTYHAVAKTWTADYFAKGVGIPYHPGALKYFKEKQIRVGR